MTKSPSNRPPRSRSPQSRELSSAASALGESLGVRRRSLLSFALPALGLLLVPFRAIAASQKDGTSEMRHTKITETHYRPMFDSRKHATLHKPKRHKRK